MKSDPTFWILARTSGLVAYLLLSASMITGLVLKSRPFGVALRPALVTDLHRFLTLLGLGAVSVHGLALLLDHAVTISLADLLLPGVAPYRPLWVALGVVAAELMLVVFVSFPLRTRIGTRNWRRLHWATYAVFALATLHGLAAGTDSVTTWALALYGGATGAVLAATAWRMLVPPERKEPRRRRERSVVA